jgi:hypothetical protein
MRSDCRFWVVACEDPLRLPCGSVYAEDPYSRLVQRGAICLSHFISRASRSEPSEARHSRPRGGSNNQRPPFAGRAALRAAANAGALTALYKEAWGVLAGDDPEATIGSRTFSRSKMQYGTKAVSSRATSGSPEPKRTPHAEPRQDANRSGRLSPAARSSHARRADANADDPQTARRPCQY